METKSIPRATSISRRRKTQASMAPSQKIRRSVQIFEFINEDLIRKACSNGLNDSESELAISIAAKFCENTFTAKACIANSMEVSTFCASTICISSKRVFDAKKGKGARNFSIKLDFYNELVAACDKGYEPIPIIRLRRPRKNQTKSSANNSNLQMAFLSANYAKQSQEVTDEEVMSYLTGTEKLIIHSVDGDLNVYALATNFSLSRSEARAIKNNITKKIRAGCIA